jgi:peptidyl-prolyl cis-trans isomerase SurA
MKNILTLCLVVSATVIFAQKSNLKNEVLFTVENDTVTAGEYMAVYNKNRDVGKDIDPKTPKEYLELYINFKLKVHEAKELGKDTLPKFLNEYGSYREQLAEPYLSDNAVTDELVREAYQRGQSDIRASHIMVSLAPNANPSDTLEAYERVMQIRKTILDGADFADVAKESSSDTYSAKKGGDLGFFTAFDMVYPFESAAYNTALGKVSMPIRSQYGYHLVKPTEKRKARGTATVAHIMIVDNDKSTKEESANAKKKVFEIYDKLKAGEDFTTLAKQYSEDKSSAMQGGVLQPFGINKMYPNFEDAVFALENKGDMTQPIQTPVGWHIIKLIKQPENKDFELSKKELKTEVERDTRALQSKESVIKRIKKDYNYKEYPKRFNLAFSQVDEGLLASTYKAINVKNADKILVEFASKSYTVADFLNFVEANQRSYSRIDGDLEATLYRAFNDFSEGQLIAYEKDQLPNKYPDFALLNREYYEGILLFDLTEEMVWKKAVKDTLGLQGFYRANQTNYKWEKRFQVIAIDAETKKVAKKAKKALKKGENMKAVLKDINENSQLALTLDSAVYEESDLELDLDNYETGDFTNLKEENGRFKFYQILKVIPTSQKPLEEAKGRVISDYQEYLEKQWITQLKSKYTVSVNKDVLDTVIEEL